MDKNKKGFTLIELLAVIVILAIIALIAVPVIMNVITKARKSAFEDSAYGIVKAGEMYYTNALLEAEGMTEDQEFTVDGNVFKNSEGKTLEISGSIPSHGKVTVTSEGKVALAISNGEYCIRKATTESKVKAEKLSDLDGKCNYKNSNTLFTTTTDGKAIPACITNNTLCDVKNAGNDGLKVGVKVNNTTTYDFYIMSDNITDNEITLIMSQNLEKKVAWASYEDYIDAGGTTEEYDECGTSMGPITAFNYLDQETSNWTNISGSTYYKTRTSRARIITSTELINLGCTFTENTCPSWLHSNGGAYWASDYQACRHPYSISTNDFNDNAVSDCGQPYGIRPVITISKSVL